MDRSICLQPWLMMATTSWLWASPCHWDKKRSWTFGTLTRGDDGRSCMQYHENSFNWQDCLLESVVWIKFRGKIEPQFMVYWRREDWSKAFPSMLRSRARLLCFVKQVLCCLQLLLLLFLPQLLLLLQQSLLFLLLAFFLTSLLLPGIFPLLGLLSLAKIARAWL